MHATPLPSPHLLPPPPPPLPLPFPPLPPIPLPWVRQATNYISWAPLLPNAVLMSIAGSMLTNENRIHSTQGGEERRGGGGGGGKVTPTCKLYRYVPPDRVWRLNKVVRCTNLCVQTNKFTCPLNCIS